MVSLLYCRLPGPELSVFSTQVLPDSRLGRPSPSVGLLGESLDHSGRPALWSVVIIHQRLPRRLLSSVVAPVKVKDEQGEKKKEFCGQHGPYAMSQSWRVTVQGSTFEALRNPAERKGMARVGGVRVVAVGRTVNLVWDTLD